MAFHVSSLRWFTVAQLSSIFSWYNLLSLETAIVVNFDHIKFLQFLGLILNTHDAVLGKLFTSIAPLFTKQQNW